MEANGLEIPSWEALVGTEKNGKLIRCAASFPTSTLFPPPMPMMQYASDDVFMTRSTFFMSEESTSTHSTGEPIESVTTPFTFSWTFAPDAITADLLPAGNSMKSPSSPRIPSPIRIRRGNSIVWEPSGIDFGAGSRRIKASQRRPARWSREKSHAEKLSNF